MNTEQKSKAKRTRRLTAQQMFVLMEMHRCSVCIESFDTAYAHTRCCLQDKGMLVFNAERGRYEVTPQGAAAAEAERAARAARRLANV